MSEPKRTRGKVAYFETWPHVVEEEILGDADGIDLSRLSLAASEDGIWRQLAAAHVYQIRATRAELPEQFHGTAELLARCPNLLAISSGGAGYDTVDPDACTEAGVILVNQAGGNAEGVAEHALGMMLMLSKRVGEADAAMRSKPGLTRTAYMGNNLEGKIVGIVGIGHVGRRVAELCGGPLRMTVLAYDPYLSADEIGARGAESCGMADLLARADVVSVHCPRDHETLNYFDAGQFARMKAGAIFINTARGGIHNEADLHAALTSGHLASAGLDVWEEEPPPTDYPLLQLDTVLASPHTAGVTHESRHRMGTIAAEQIIDILAGKRPPRLINPAAWEAYRGRFEAIFGFQPKS
jgi:D-3-phosphoglycerate dehydrogenase